MSIASNKKLECQSSCSSTIHPVVDPVDEVCWVCGCDHQISLVLLDDRLDPVVHVWDVVDIGNLLVWAVRGYGASSSGEHARELAVGLHVGVVDVDLVGPAEVLDSVVVHDCRRSRRCQGERCSCSRGGHLLPTAIDPTKHGTDGEGGKHTKGAAGFNLC